jgi:hypothetical protein
MDSQKHKPANRLKTYQPALARQLANQNELSPKATQVAPTAACAEEDA